MPSTVRDANINRGLWTKTMYTFATLPAAANNQGCEAFISDCNASPQVAAGQVAVGGGNIMCRVQCDGTAWRIGAPSGFE